jgi:probable phosphoglycerate mutase
MITNLYLIRHGQAFCNVEPIVAGMEADTGLSPLGIQQAEHLRERLATTHEIKADVLIASTLPRARQTAEIIAPALGLPITWDEEFHEMRPGEADGLTLDQAHAKYGIPDLRYEPLRALSPGGENYGQFILRVGMALDRVAHEHKGKTVVIVCHGGVIDGSFLCFFGLSTLALPQVEFHTHNTSITHWQRRYKAGQPPRWRLVKYNDDLHLREIGVEEAEHWEAFTGTPVTGVDHPAVPVPTEAE